jgi:hypothetical protein
MHQIQAAINRKLSQATNTRIRGRRSGGQQPQERSKIYCIFHGQNFDHGSTYCPNKKRMDAILEEEKKQKERNESCQSHFFSLVSAAFLPAVSGNESRFSG